MSSNQTFMMGRAPMARAPLNLQHPVVDKPAPHAFTSSIAGSKSSLSAKPPWSSSGNSNRHPYHDNPDTPSNLASWQARWLVRKRDAKP
jgi:hypothetical protein